MLRRPRRALPPAPLAACAATLAAALAVPASNVAAQLGPVNPFSFGLSAGAAVPTGSGASGIKTGYSVDALVGLRVPVLPVRFRGEFGYTRFGIKDLSGNVRSLSGVANVIYSFGTGPAGLVRPYVIAGLGAYNLKASVSGDGEQVSGGDGTRLGLNGGVGLELPLTGFTAFGEARYTSVFTSGGNTSWIPLRFGVRF